MNIFSGETSLHKNVLKIFTFWSKMIFLENLGVTKFSFHHFLVKRNFKRWNQPTSVTRLGNLLHFGQFVKATWKQLICPNPPTLLGNFCKGVKIYPFSSQIIFGQLLQTFGDVFLVTLQPMNEWKNEAVDALKMPFYLFEQINFSSVFKSPAI